MLSRQHNFYQQFLQVVDAVIIAVSLWIAHLLRFYVLNGMVWFDGYPLAPQFANCYWMIALVLPFGPLALEYMGVYEMNPSIGWFPSVWRVIRAMFLVLLAIFTCLIVFHIPQETVSRAALGLFFIIA